MTMRKLEAMRISKLLASFWCEIKELIRVPLNNLITEPLNKSNGPA